MKFLFCGDVMGQACRKAVTEYVPLLRKKYALDAVIMNGENAAHGLGLTPKTYQDLIRAGADAITMGNHTFDKIDIVKIWAEDNVLVRPLNYPSDTAGKGYHMIDVAGQRLCVVQVLGRTFMHSKLELADPFETMQTFLDEHQSEYDVLVVDYHAETTAEKVVMGYFLDGKAALVVGTHTHIPTNDAHILPNKTAYLTDAGMCGDYTSVIGMTRETAFSHFGLGTERMRFEPSTESSTFSGIFVETNGNQALSCHCVILGDTLENTTDL